MLKSSLFATGVLMAVLAGCEEADSPAAEPAPAEASAPDAAETAAEPSPQARIETAIIPAVLIEGEAQPTLTERMAHYGAPQVSVAVWRDGALDWAKAYGDGADSETLFQAASLSKVVAATGIVALAQEQGVSLDEDISGALTGTDLETLNPDGAAITLRRLLSHTNGATVGGFGGYPAGAPVPTNAEVVTGSERTNSDAVRIEAEGIGTFSYAGGGYQLAQLWAEQVSGEAFEAMMERLILSPVGMTRSRFAQPLADDVATGNVARAYESDGSEVEGGWHVYPEQAAAGLWTTPAEFGRFVLALTVAANGETGAGIDPDVAREVTQAVSEDYGLGIGIETAESGERVWRHSGSNRGYKSYFEAWPDRGDAIVAMSGAERSYPLNADIVRTAKHAYGWPVNPVRTRTRVEMDADTLARFEGAYGDAADGETLFTITTAAPDLRLETRRGVAYRLVPLGEALFIDPDDGQEAAFEMADGAMTLTTGGRTFTRLEAARPQEDD